MRHALVLPATLLVLLAGPGCGGSTGGDPLDGDPPDDGSGLDGGMTLPEDGGGGGGEGGGGGGGGGEELPTGPLGCEGGVTTGGRTGNEEPKEHKLPAACSGASSSSWMPKHGPHGWLKGSGVCGSMTGNCPTQYTSANVGAPCSSDGQCTGPRAVCLTGSLYPGGMCSSRGCEMGSNRGCPVGSTCVEVGTETYCHAGCGISEDDCFVHCDRGSYACFTTESPSLGYCLGADAARSCDPSDGLSCSTSRFDQGFCKQSSWDDPTVGRCHEACNPIAQDCSKSDLGCYAVRDRPMPTCYQNWGRKEGEACTRLTHCEKGLSCQCQYDDYSRCQPGNVNMQCRKYCMPSCDQCGDGYRCRKIPGWPYGSCIPI
jgi:hypothetical protein